MRDLHTIEAELRALASHRPHAEPQESRRIDELLDEMICSLAVLDGYGAQMWPD